MTPDKHTNQELMLKVGDGHEIYVQDWGNPQARTPILFLHGGPGGSCGDKDKRNFDPARQRVIFHDQRGSGRSLPYASLRNNTTQDLIDDIEKIAGELKIASFVLTGASWGPCLALAYALQHPERVQAMVLRAVFTGSQAEIDHLSHGVYRDFFPEAWERLLARTPAAHHADPNVYHYKHALGKDEAKALRSARAIIDTESALIRLDDRFTPYPDEEFRLDSARLEIHYLANGCFLPDRHILDNAHKLTMPVWLVQGRYDFVCPPRTAYELHRSLPDSELIWTIAGHQAEHEGWNIMRTILLQLTT